MMDMQPGELERLKQDALDKIMRGAAAGEF